MHKNRFKNGWFTLLRFTNEVNKKAQFLDELKSWVASNKIEKPDWVEPVIIFDKEKHEVKKPRRRNSGVRKMNLVIGIEDEDGKEKKKEAREPAAQVKELP